MKLNDLFKKIYLRKDKTKGRTLAGDTYDPTRKERTEGLFESFEEKVLDKQTGREITETQIHKRNKKFLVFGMMIAGILVGIVVVIILYFKFIGSAFLEEKIAITIDGPDRVSSAEQTVYKITMENVNRISLQNVKLRLSYPENMEIQQQPFIQKLGFNSSKINVGSIPANGKKEYEVLFKPFGPRDQQVFLNAVILYQPKNFNSTFEKSAQKSIVIKSSPISLTVLPVKEAASGEFVTIDLIVKNSSAISYKNLELRMNYPEGFLFDKSDPSPTRDKRVWEISNLVAKEQMKINISGTLEGSVDSLKKFHSTIGEQKNDNDFLVYTEDEGIIKVIQSRVQITVRSPKKAIYPGNNIKYNIVFRNTSDVPLRDLIIYQYVNSELINDEMIFPADGYYDSEKKVMFWKASDIPSLKNLQPGAEGTVSSSVNTLSVVPMNNENDKNFTAVSYVEIESLDVDSPLWRNKRIRSMQDEVKFHSKMAVSVSAMYNDAELPGSGPVPLVLAEETVFTIRFSIMNTSNDIKNVILNTSMPSGIIWKDNYLPKNAGVEANTRSNHIKWIIGTVDAGVGFISPVQTLAFQVGVRPSANQTSVKLIKLLNSIEIVGLDSFTGKEVIYGFDGISLSNVNDINLEIIN